MSNLVRRIAQCATTLSAVAVFLSVFAPTAIAQEQKDKALPVIGDHHFIMSSEVPDPFITSFFRNATGGGIGFNIENLLTDASGDTILDVSGDIGFLSLGFEYQGKLASWVAIRVGFEGSARVGTSLESLLGNGVSAVYGYFLGGTFRLVETEKIFLSAVADLTGNSITDVGILNLVQQAIDQDTILPDSANAVNTGTDKAGLGGFRFAWAASRLIGVRLNAGFGIADLFQSNKDTKFSFAGGGAVGFNFANTTSVPIGLLVFFKTANFNPGASDVVDATSSTGLEVLYSGHRDFGLGLALAWERADLTQGRPSIKTFKGTINLRYYF